LARFEWINAATVDSEERDEDREREREGRLTRHHCVISALAERAIASSLAYVKEICNGSRISQMEPSKYPMSYSELPLSLFLPFFICFFLFFRFCFLSVVRSRVI